VQNSAFRQNADTTKRFLKTQAALSVADKKAFERPLSGISELEIHVICSCEVVSDAHRGFLIGRVFVEHGGI
jgi:hypothetical protein